MGGWAAITPLGSAVVASGIVTTEGNKKTIQHLEGGIIKEILIREGQHVEAGEIIIAIGRYFAASQSRNLSAISSMLRLRAKLGLLPNSMAAQTFSFRTS